MNFLIYPLRTLSSIWYLEDPMDPPPTATGNRGRSQLGCLPGFGLPEDTNARFHYLSRNQQSKRLSTAFDGPTLYGVGAGTRGGVFGKIGEGGVAVDTVDDVERLYAGFALDQPRVSV